MRGSRTGGHSSPPQLLILTKLGREHRPVLPMQQTGRLTYEVGRVHHPDRSRHRGATAAERPEIREKVRRQKPNLPRLSSLPAMYKTRKQTQPPRESSLQHSAPTGTKQRRCRGNCHESPRNTCARLVYVP